MEAKRAGRRAAGAPPWVAGRVGGMARAPQGVTDGKGLVFVSHTGDVYPSGLLPLCAGKVRATPLADLYRHAPLRDPRQLGGTCAGAARFARCAAARAPAPTRRPGIRWWPRRCAYKPRRNAERGMRNAGAQRSEVLIVRIANSALRI
jgi:hypothetical protein